MKNRYLECGKIINTHGVRGALKIEPYCNSPLDFTKLPCVYIDKGGSLSEHRMLRASVYKGYVIATLEGIDSFEQAQELKNKLVYAARESFSLAEGESFLADIIGLQVVDADTGRVYGTVADIDEAPASLIYTVRTQSGDVLLPAVKEFIKEVDIERGVFITPIPGFFDEI